MSNILKGDKVVTEHNKQEQLAWDNANSTATVDSYQDYLSNYPNGVYATQALACIDKLKASSLVNMCVHIKQLKGEKNEVNIESGVYHGEVIYADECHILLKIYQHCYTIHDLSTLDRMPSIDDLETRIKYQSGRGVVAGMGKSEQCVEKKGGRE